MADARLLEDGSFRLLEDGSLRLTEVQPQGTVVDGQVVEGRVLIALTGGPLDPNPTWTAFDNLSTCRCGGFDISVGRRSEFEATDISTVRVYFHDRNQTLNDPALVGKQIMLQLFNPVTGELVPRWKGHIDEPTLDVHPDAPDLTDVQLNCKGIFDLLSRTVMTLDFGDVPPAGMESRVFYEDGPVDERITSVLVDAGLEPSRYVVFSGNVDVLESIYDPGDDDVLSGVRDGADAEFPGIANVYEDRYGRVVFHGRFARFTPDDVADDAGPVAWDFQRWEAATREDVTTGVAQIREFGFSYPRTRLINSYIAWPRGIRERDKPGQQRSDAGSIAANGLFGRSAPDLIVKKHKTNGNTGLEECQLFADFYVNNYSDARTNVERVTFKAIHPDDARAAAVWDLMTRADVSDVIALTIDEAGIAAEDYYIEGLEIQCRALNPQFDYVEVSPSLTPAAYYLDNVFE